MVCSFILVWFVFLFCLLVFAWVFLLLFLVFLVFFNYSVSSHDLDSTQ